MHLRPNTMANPSNKMKLFDHQREAVAKLKTGSILVGGVGSGKSLTALTYYAEHEWDKDLYIITTARKRDTLDWENEYQLVAGDNHFIPPWVPIVDSWNNAHKYVGVKNAFFIFDEQRIVGSGTWVKSFLRIAKQNPWILLSATPGDTWMDYIPLFIANGFYKNRTEFIRRHVVYNNFSKFPKIERYMETGHLNRLRESIIVDMHYTKQTIPHIEIVPVGFDKEATETVWIKRWNLYKQQPIKDIGELCHLVRKVVNSDPRRVGTVGELLKQHPRAIVFYNFNYELDLLLALGEKLQIPVAQWNGKKHEEVPDTERWMYLVQYTAGAEGWNCTTTNVIIFFSQNYSHRVSVQAAGRIDRLNTPFTDLYYYHLISDSVIDRAIQRALKNKRNFNERRFVDWT
jgi:hypothetical protein